MGTLTLVRSVTATLGVLAGSLAVANERSSSTPSPDGGAGLGWGESYSVSAALAELPDVRGFLHVSTADLATFSEGYGIGRPTSLADPQLPVWADELGAGRHLPIALPEVFNRDGLSSIQDWGAAIGWTGYVDAASFIAMTAGGRAAERSIAVIAGDQMPVQYGPAVVEIGNGIFSYGSGADGQHDPEHTSFDPDGRPLRMASKEGLIAASFSTAPVSWWLAGPSPSVADDPTIAAIGRALDDGAAMSALIRRAQFVYDRFDGTPSEITEAMTRTVVSQPFSAVGIGWSEGTTTMVYAFGNAEAAEVAAGELATLFHEGTTYGGERLAERIFLQDVLVDGPLVVLTAVEETPWEIWTLFYGRDTPFTFVAG